MRGTERKQEVSGAAGRLGAVLLAVCALCASLPPGIARAATVEDERGVSIGLKFVGASLHADESSSVFFIKDDGGGAQLDLGYRFNPVFMLELVAGGSNHETSDPAIDAKTAAVQLFAHYRFSPDRAFRPFLKGGVGGYALTLESNTANLRLEGGGIAIGGGFRYFLSPRFSLGVDLTHSMIRYDEAQLSLSAFSYQSSIDEHGSLTTLGLMFGYSF